MVVHLVAGDNHAYQAARIFGSGSNWPGNTQEMLRAGGTSSIRLGVALGGGGHNCPEPIRFPPGNPWGKDHYYPELVNLKLEVHIKTVETFTC